MPEKPAKSKSISQQQLFGIAHAIQKGEMPASQASGAAREIAKDVDKSDVHDFAATKHKGLPEHAKKSSVGRLMMAAHLIRSKSIPQS